ncbi:MAG TPA: peptidylprolyl isomerase, partial [Arenimonas sp.]|nr:peptidylprolyl isomerase [Arenimonas sp.]
ANNGMSIDQLRERLAADGVPYEEYRAGVREEIQLQRLRQRVVQSRVQISEGEIDQMLATTDVGGAEVRLANILVALPDGATPDQIATAQKKIDGIKDLIDSGEMDFAAAAIRYSDAQNALDGGDIGWRGFDAIPPAFVNVLRDMKPGDVTTPVRGPTGFQLVKLVESRDSSQQTMTQFNAQSILIRVTDLLPAEAARQKAQDLRDQIAAGGDFAALAKQHSDDTMTRDKGGDMGWFGINDWGTAIANQLQQMADGALSPVFQSDIGFHIVRRIGSREQDVTEQNRRNKAREMIGQRKAEEEYERFLRQLRADAYVDSRLGG